mmetsp:Transcript_2362/g.3098  ORF Transcript_2362/g.3098 Transcript_2362/m.3098 type:complete len:181 (-) Transcript_2362:18-560(-)
MMSDVKTNQTANDELNDDVVVVNLTAANDNNGIMTKVTTTAEDNVINGMTNNDIATNFAIDDNATTTAKEAMIITALTNDVTHNHHDMAIIGNDSIRTTNKYHHNTAAYANSYATANKDVLRNYDAMYRASSLQQPPEPQDYAIQNNDDKQHDHDINQHDGSHNQHDAEQDTDNKVEVSP